MSHPLPDIWSSANAYLVCPAEDEWAQVRARKDYEHDFFFVSQLYDENWQPHQAF